MGFRVTISIFCKIMENVGNTKMLERQMPHLPERNKLGYENLAQFPNINYSVAKFEDTIF